MTLLWCLYGTWTKHRECRKSAGNFRKSAGDCRDFFCPVPFPLSPFDLHRMSAPKITFSCRPNDGKKRFDPKASGRKGQECPRKIRTVKSLYSCCFFQGCQSGAFGKRSFCRGDTHHFRHFRRCPGFKEQTPLFLWVECNISIFANFRQNHLFSAGGKTQKRPAVPNFWCP